MHPTTYNSRMLKRFTLIGASYAIALAVLTGFLLGFLAQPVWAAAITVTTTSDELTTNGNCSLREAISNANNDAATYPDCVAGSGADTITLPAGTYVLTLAGLGEDGNVTGDLDIDGANAELTIMGAGSATTRIDGNFGDRVLHAGTSATITLQALTVQNGFLTDMVGAGLFAEFRGATLSDVIFYNNVITSLNNYAGGGAYFGGVATVTNTQFISNASTNYGGGAFFNLAATVSGSLFQANRTGFNGGGAYFQNTTTVTGTTFQSNTVPTFGGGAYFINNASELMYSNFISNTGSTGGGAAFTNGGFITSSTFMSNTAINTGGGVYYQNNAMAVITGTQFIGNRAPGNSAGGLFSNSAITVNNSLFISNSSANGGAARFISVTVLNNTNFLSNTAATAGAIYLSAGTAHLTLNSGTIAYNTANYAGGIYVTTGVGPGPQMLMNGGEIRNNTSNSTGGGVSLVQNSTFTMTGGLIANNQALGGFAGGVEVYLSRMLMTGGVISQNTAMYNGVFGGAGGGVAVRNNGVFTLTNGLIISNTTTNPFLFGGGGGVFVDTGGATLTGGQISGNTSAFYGGGLLNSFGAVNLAGTQINANTASSGSAVFLTTNFAQLTTTVPTAITGSVASWGSVNAANHDLVVNGDVEVLGGVFNAPTNFTITGIFTQTGGVFNQTRSVTGSGDVGFPKAGGLLINANGLGNLGNTQVSIQAGSNCTTTADETITHCYTITPTLSSGVSTTLTFFFNNVDLGANHACNTLNAYRWDGTLQNILILDPAYDSDGRLCASEPFSVRVKQVDLFGKFVLAGQAGFKLYLPLIQR